ncbi:hypothetical protein MBLNU459_g8127t1 [Dothideomycetes sp. NU459]
MSALRSPRVLSARLSQLSHTQTRALSHSRTHLSAWKPGPAPPRLPKEEQERFEKLQQQSTGAFSQPRTTSEPSAPAAATAQPSRLQINQSPQSSSSSSSADDVSAKARVDASGKGEELHPNVRRGAPPEFEGETNPKTGEVGGPKNEPLRWGHGGDWSYNGRVTDF